MTDATRGWMFVAGGAVVLLISSYYFGYQRGVAETIVSPPPSVAPESSPSVSASAPEAPPPPCVREACSERPAHLICLERNGSGEMCLNFKIGYEHHCDCVGVARSPVSRRPSWWKACLERAVSAENDTAVRLNVRYADGSEFDVEGPFTKAEAEKLSDLAIELATKRRSKEKT